MSREIHDHKTNTTNDNLRIAVTDQPGAGGANHRYEVVGFQTETNASRAPGGDVLPLGIEIGLVILFQNGPIPETGVNGVTQEVLIAIVIDRLRSFQAGPFSSKENAVALTHLETALLWLQKRTHDRVRRGVEGTHQK